MLYRCGDVYDFDEKDFPGCCESCHDDEDLGYTMPRFDYKEDYYEVCCRVSEWLRNKFGIKE